MSAIPSVPVTPPVSVAPSASSTKTPVGAIVGGVVGGVFLLLLVCGGIDVADAEGYRNPLLRRLTLLGIASMSQPKT